MGVLTDFVVADLADAREAPRTLSIGPNYDSPTSPRGAFALLNRLRTYLPENEAQFRADRDPADPDTLFRYTHSLEVDGRWRLFVFSICDSISPDHFFVEGVAST